MNIKPEFRRDLIEIEYWFCGDDDHCHKTEISAQNCIDRRPKFCRKERTRDNRIRDISVARFILEGSSCDEAGIKFGVSRSRAKQILVRVLRNCRDPGLNKEKSPEWMFSRAIKTIIKNKDFWIQRVNELENYWISK